MRSVREQVKDGVSIVRLSVGRAFEKKYYQSDLGWLDGYYELSINNWSKGEENIVGLALSPVLQYHFYQGLLTLRPYVEAGIGLSLIDATEINGRDLTTNVQFEDRIGIGLASRQVNLNVRYLHYSNGSIKQPNVGIDILLTSISWFF